MSALPKTERKEQILLTALEIIAVKGYGRLSMRELARESGLKLGALQYHFPTWEELLRALAAYVCAEYNKSAQTLTQPSTIHDLLRWYLEDSGGKNLHSELLWPQLWAMSRVEPVMRESLEEIFRGLVADFETHLARAGSASPRLEALALLSLGEGSLLFTGAGSPWEAESGSFYEAITDFMETRYPKE